MHAGEQRPTGILTGITYLHALFAKEGNLLEMIAVNTKVLFAGEYMVFDIQFN